MSEDNAQNTPLAPESRDQRSHPRVRVRVRARTLGPGVDARNVEIRDVGIGGMFIAARVRDSEMRAPHAGLAADDGQVHLTFQVPSEESVLAVSGRPLRITEHGFGLAFDGHFLNEAVALVDAVGGNLSFDKAEPSRVSANLMADIEDVVSTWLLPRLAVFAEKAEHRLIARAGAAPSNAEQTPFFDAIGELKRRISDLEAAIIDLLQQRLERLGAPLVIAEEDSVVQAMELSLIEKDAYEVYLIIADMAAKAESRHDLLLYRLGRFLSTLASTSIDNANNPLAPSALCDRFHECMHDAPIAGEAIGLICQSFDDGVIKDLKPLYESIVTLFERSGLDLTPEPPPAVFMAPGARDSSAASTAATPAGEMPPVPGPSLASGTPATQPAQSAQPGAGSGVDWGPAEDVSPLEWVARQGNADPPAPAPPPAASDSALAPVPAPTGLVSPSAQPDTGSDQRADTDQQAWGQSGGDAFFVPPASYAPQPVPTAPVADSPVADKPPAEPLLGLDSQRPPSFEDLLVPDAAPGFLGMPESAPIPGGATPGAGSVDANSPGADLSQWRSSVGLPVPAAPQHFPPRVVQPPAQYALPAPQPGSAFGAVQALMGLRGGGQQATVATVAPPSSEAVLGMLAQVQAQMSADGGNFRSGVREVLGVDSDFSGASSLGEVGDAVALVGALCGAMREDSEVSVHLAKRLQNLEPAIHKVVVLDPSFFEQSGHPTRQVLNQLARIVPSLTPVPGATANEEVFAERFWDDLDALLAPLTERFDRDMSLFDVVLAELDLVLDQQQQTYVANLQAVVDACEAQAEFIRKRRGQSSNQSRTSEESERGMSKEWSVWLRRAGRLEPGEAIEFTRGEKVERCRVAWMDDERASFVLVNVRGEKVQTWSRQELAMQLRRGSAAVIRDHDLPLVDRALSRVLQEVHSSVERQATHVSDSGLLNRRAFGAQLKKALDQAVGSGDGVAVLYITLDEYDDIFERYGAQPARMLMQRVVRRVAAVTGDEEALGTLSPGDVVGFVPDMTVEQATTCADQICTNINRMKVRWGEEQLKLTARAGVVLAPPGDDVTDVLAAAERVITDDASTIDQAPGVHADVRVEASAPSMMDYVSLINNTLGNDQMQLRCQRVQPLEIGRRVRPYFEVLLGVRDKHNDAVAAGDFIRAAQHYEQMPALDRWVMRSTFRWMADHRRWLRHVAGFSVNLSPSALQDENLTEYALELLNETGVPPGKLIFEITEAAAVQDAGPSQNFLRTLSEVGCQFALDDFGGGDGSYGYLKQLPVAYVKIDGQFTRELATDEANLAAVQSLCEVAHFMGMKSVAEQVETVESLNALAGVGVNFVQGYCIERPCYFEALEESSLKEIPRAVMTTIERRSADTQSATEETLSF
jgi:EAL domain-containing protein (putative c-di-GMP-specific phosphodiesterase class I)/GGDEF domain-containing protein